MDYISYLLFLGLIPDLIEVNTKEKLIRRWQ